MDTIIQVDNIYFYYKPGLEKFFFKVYIFLKVLPIKYFFWPWCQYSQIQSEDDIDMSFLLRTTTSSTDVSWPYFFPKIFLLQTPGLDIIYK